jgi:hypothetical protein
MYEREMTEIANVLDATGVMSIPFADRGAETHSVNSRMNRNRWPVSWRNIRTAPQPYKSVSLSYRQTGNTKISRNMFIGFDWNTYATAISTKLQTVKRTSQ